MIALLQRDKSRKFIAQQIVRWLESEHPLKAKILPTEWLGEHSAELVSDAVNSLLDDISRDRAHQIRYAFDRATFALIDKLKNDPEMAARADAVKSYLKEDEAFNRYLSELWGDLREWLKADINSEDSRVKERIARAGQWFGETLIADDALRASLNGHLEQGYVTANRVKYRQRSAVYPCQRYAGWRLYWANFIFVVAAPGLVPPRQFLEIHEKLSG